jgi:hypothetical protein
VCGAVTKVVVDPVAQIVTHLVIEPPPGEEAGRLVPLELAESTNGEVHLACTVEEFKKLETAEESHFIAGSSGHGTYAPLQAMSWPFYTIGGGVSEGGPARAAMVNAFPLGAIAVRRGEHVYAVDGEIGRVQGLVVAPGHHHVTHVLLQEGHSGGRSEVAIPIGAVRGLDGGIHLILTKQEIEELPVVEVGCQGGLRVRGGVTLPAKGAPGGDPEEVKEEADDEVIAPDRSGIEASGAAIDEILDHWAERERKWAEERLELEAERERFLHDFEELSQNTIKPAMEAVVHRLQKDGGGGIVWDGESQTTGRPRLILWMSLEGEIEGTPRQDRNPYLQLDANVIYRRIDLWEGDMWQKLGTSRATSPWQLSEITSESITERIVGILERAAGHNEAH